MEVSQNGGSPKNAKLDHVSIETHCDLGIYHFQNPSNGGNNGESGSLKWKMSEPSRATMILQVKHLWNFVSTSFLKNDQPKGKHSWLGTAVTN